MCAFDLLASVAETLLTDPDSSSNVHNTSRAVTSYGRNRKSIKGEYFNESLPLKNMAVMKDCGSGYAVGSGGVAALPRKGNDGLAENLSTRNEAESTVKSLTVKSNMLARDSSVRCRRPCDISRGLGIICEYGAFGICHPRSSNSAEAGQAHQAELDDRPPALLSSDSSSGVLLCSHDKEHKAASLCQVEMQHAADRDDDENSSGCTHPSTTGNEGYKPHFLGNHRIRKLLASKVRKAARNKTSGRVSSIGMPIPWCQSVFPCFTLCS
jgi:hypothetical protein